MTVRDIMTAQPKTASRDTTLAAAAHLLWGADCGILPVVDGGKLVGVVMTGEARGVVVSSFEA